VSVRLRNMDTFYTVEMQIGSPPAPIRMFVDSGSSNIWVKDKSIAPSQNLKKELAGRPVQFEYAAGSILGAAAAGPMCLGGLCVEDQALIIAQEIKGISNLPAFDGFLGLAFPRMLDVGSRTFLQGLQALGGFQNLGFSLALRGTRHTSSLAFGEVSDLIQEAETKAAAEGVALDVHGLEPEQQLAEGFPGVLLFWMVPLQLQVDATSRKEPGWRLLELTGFGILDSGTSLMLLSDHAYTETMAALTYGTSAQDLHGLLDCETTELNPLTIHFNGHGGVLDVTFTTRDLLLQVAEREGRSLCRVGIGSMAKAELLPSMILGDIFLRKVYAIHDMSGPTVTLVPYLGAEAMPLPSLADEHHPSPSSAPANYPSYVVLTGACCLLAVCWLCALWRVRCSGDASEHYVRLL